MATSTVRKEIQASPAVNFSSRYSKAPESVWPRSSGFDLPHRIGNRAFNEWLGSGVLQRKCNCGGTCSHCSEDETLHRKETGGARAANPLHVPKIVYEVLRSPGDRLDSTTRNFFESSLGHDFSQVRVHADGKAAQSAQAVNARAYTVGRDVVFASGRYQPREPAGLRLLGHELTHVVQQSRVRNVERTNLSISDPGDHAEREADQAAGQVLSGRQAAISSKTGPVLHRTADDAAGALIPPTIIGAALGAFAGPIGALVGGLVGLGAGALWGWLTGAFSGSDRSWRPAANPDGSCRSAKIDVRATHTGGQGSVATVVGALPFFHLFIVYTDQNGRESFFRSGPGGRCATTPAGGYGALQSQHAPYVRGTIDWEPSAPSTTVLRGAQACGKDACFTTELQRIDANCVTYEPLGNNSNTVARTLLSKCGVPQNKPVPITPGWGQPDL